MGGRGQFVCTREDLIQALSTHTQGVTVCLHREEMDCLRRHLPEGSPIMEGISPDCDTWAWQTRAFTDEILAALATGGA